MIYVCPECGRVRVRRPGSTNLFWGPGEWLTPLPQTCPDCEKRDGPTRADGSLNTTCPSCSAATTAHKHVIDCWKCGTTYQTGKS